MSWHLVAAVPYTGPEMSQGDHHGVHHRATHWGPWAAAAGVRGNHRKADRKGLLEHHKGRGPTGAAAGRHSPDRAPGNLTAGGCILAAVADCSLAAAEGYTPSWDPHWGAGPTSASVAVVAGPHPTLSLLRPVGQRSWVLGADPRSCAGERQVQLAAPCDPP